MPRENPTAVSFYIIEFPFKKIDFTNVTSDENNIPATVEIEDNATTLSINLNERILNHTNPISIELIGTIEDELIYESDRSKMLNLPGHIDNIVTKSLDIRYPITFKELFPSITDWDLEENNNFISLKTKNPPKHINLVWGDELIYDFQMKKNLFNSPDEPAKSFEITIPKAHYNQNVIISEIRPIPQSAYQDKEGNIFLSYHLEPNTDMNIHISGQIAKVLEESILLSPFERPKLTETKGYWELSDKYEINRFQVNLKRNGVEEDNINEMDLETRKEFYKFAYEYVIERLNLQNIKTTSMESNHRQGANEALKQRHNSAPEDYVDLLSAIYRSYGVPTKMIEGYVLQKNSFYHSWLEYWDIDMGWNMIDPALEDYTNQNFFNSNMQNHVVILTRAYNYLNPRMTFFGPEDFVVSFAVNKMDENISVENEITINPIRQANETTSGIIEIKNTGNTIISMEDFVEQANINFGVYNNFQLIVPGQTLVVPFVYSADNNEDENVWVKYISINGKELLNPIRLESEEDMLWWWDLLITTATLVIIWTIIYIIYLVTKKTHKWIKNYYQ